MSRWFRHYAGMARDDKLVSVAIRSKQTVERVVWVWGAILESAAEIDDNGRFLFDCAEAAYFLRSDEADIQAVVDGLASSGRLDAGVVVNWSRRQFVSDRSAERQARLRERKKAGERGSDGNKASPDADVTSLSRDGDSPETDTETEEVTTPDASAPRPDLSRLASQLEKAGGEAIDDPARSPGLLALSEPLNWIDSGCDLDLDILPTLKARSAGRPPREIRTWGYFTKAVFQARDTRLRPSPEPTNVQPSNRQGQPASRPRSGADTFLAAVRAEAEQLDDRGFPDRRDSDADFGDGRTLDLRANEAA